MRIGGPIGGAYTGIILLLFMLAFVAIVGISALCGYVFMLAWNFVAPDVFHAGTVTFWQAWAIWFLICLVGSAFRSTVNRSKSD